MQEVIADNPQLLPEWDSKKNAPLGLFPEKLRKKSNKKVYWKCSNGHSWQMEVHHRTNGRGCPFCNHKRVLKGFNDLTTLFPEIAAEWHPTGNPDKNIDDYVQGSATRIQWQCKTCQHSWIATIRARTQRKSGCPECAKKIRGKTRKQTNLANGRPLDNPQLLTEWDYQKNPMPPSEYLPGSNEKVWWKCSTCGHEWKALISNRALSGRGCPCCANKKVAAGKNDLATTHPELAQEWHPTKNLPLMPQEVFAGSAQKVWWKCPTGHEYKASLLHRSQGTNCPHCNAGRQTSFAEQAVFYYIKQLYPDAQNRVQGLLGQRMELDIYIPSIHLAIEYDGSFWHNHNKPNKRERDEKKYALCQAQHIYLIRIREDRNEKTQKLADEVWHMENLENLNQLSKLIQLVIDKLDPRSNFLTRKRVKDIHSPIHVDVKRDEFKIRRYQQVLKKDSLAEQFPKIAAEWHPTKNDTLTPQMFLPGSTQKIWWLCPVCQKEWQTPIYHRTHSKTGCPACHQEHIKENHPNAVSIYQYTKDWNLIRIWKSISAAARELKINSSNISTCAKHERNLAGGFHWEYQPIEEKRFIQGELFPNE